MNVQSPKKQQRPGTYVLYGFSPRTPNRFPPQAASLLREREERACSHDIGALAAMRLRRGAETHKVWDLACISHWSACTVKCHAERRTKMKSLNR